MKTIKAMSKLALVGLGSMMLTFSPVSQAAQNCVAGTWQSPPNNYWDSLNGGFPIQAQSAHFQLRWSSTKAAPLTGQEAQNALDAMEKIYAWFTGPQVNWPEPFCNSATKDKIQIFTDSGYGLSGAGGGPKTPAMWVNPNALLDAGRGGPIGGMVHEFTHAMQYNTTGMRNTALGGWFWESHAEFMAHQYPANPDKTGVSTMAAWMPHLYYGSTRDRYGNWQFWNYVKDKYSFTAVNNIWVKSAGMDGQDPLDMLMKNQGWSASALGDEFGQYAMKNVNWDYIDVQDGYNRGAEFRKIYGKNTDVNNPWGQVSERLRLARLEPIDVAQRRFVVSTYFAPQRYGYNVVKLVPDSGASSITVSFRGVVQNGVAPGAEVGTGAYQPGASPDWTNFKMPQPSSNWRWGVVAIDQNGNSRYSAMQRGAVADLNFTLQAGDREVYMVVAATPDQHQSIFWDQMYHTLYRYPYKVQLSNALPDGYQPGYSAATANAYPAGHKHANGGGWVADTASVDASAYVGPFAAVLGGAVRGNARIEDYAVIWNGTVQDNAIVGGLSQLNSNVSVSGNAQVRAIMAGGSTFGNGGKFAGTVKLFGDLESYLGNVTTSTGAFSGFVDENNVNKPEFGATRSALPVEVTAAVPAGWPGGSTPPPPPPPSMVLPSGAVECAVEEQTCTMPDSGRYTIYYGANGAYAVRSGITGSLLCNNTSFTDPLPGTQKRCYRKAESTTTLPSNSPPTVNLTAPTSNASFNQAALISFAASANDIDGTVSKVDLFDNGNLIGTDNTAPYTWTWGSASVGNHAFTAKAYDDKGAVTTSSAVNVTVKAPSATPPSGAVKCASNRGTCTLPAGKTATVWFGAMSSYKVLVGKSGNVACNTATFGGDPIWYAFKSCYYVNN